MRALPLLFAGACLCAAEFEAPQLVGLHPLGGKAGTAVEVEILGTHLGTATEVEFDCAELTWKHTTKREAGKLQGIVWIDPGAALGGHVLHVVTADGPSSSLLFNVGQFPATIESDSRALSALPVEIYGRLDGAADSDTYWFTAHSGERWLFDMRAMEHGSAVESRMLLLNGQGERIAFNDDRDQYDENPLIEHTFAEDGLYAVKLDQYRGPRGFTFSKNNAYILRISALPRIRSIDLFGARRGRHTRFAIEGTALRTVQRAYLTELRRGEYERMTYPYTMPIHFRADPARAADITRIDGKTNAVSDTRLEADFAIPANCNTGLWRLWLAGPNGVTEGPNLEISDVPEIGEETASGKLPEPPFIVNGMLSRPRERDVYRIAVKEGKPIHFSTLAVQLGGGYLDTMLTLRDAAGKTLAQDDDVVAGWGGLLGNPDSSLFYTPEQDGDVFLEVRDRQNRGGAAFAYRLKVDQRVPGFQLFTTPENFTVRRGQTGSLKVHLIREMGFSGEVELWIEGLPTEAPLSAKFRADQVFEPNADGADMIIPEVTFEVQAPKTAGTYPLRIFGKAAGGNVVEAHTATMIGPIYQGDWNFYRRPVPTITMTVVE